MIRYKRGEMVEVPERNEERRDLVPFLEEKRMKNLFRDFSEQIKLLDVT